MAVSVARVGNADHLHVRDAGMGVEELLDLPGVEVLAAVLSDAL